MNTNALGDLEPRSPPVEMGGVIPEAQAGRSVLPKACENCRIRKIRCDKGSPCMSCQMVNLPCRSAAAKPPEKIRSTHLSHHEKHFNLIHESLQDIRDQLRKLDQKQAPTPPAFENNLIPAVSTPAPTSDVTYQGESSFECHSAQASLSAEFSARGAQGGNLGKQINISLSSLKSLLQNQGRSSSLEDLAFPHSAVKSAVTPLELPPIPVVLAALKRASAHTPFVLLHSAQRDHSILEDLCRKVYFPTKPYSQGEIILMNGMLSFVFAEYCANPDLSLSVSDCAKYAKLCEKNFIAGLQSYECLVTPTLENIQCLMIGAMKAQEESRPSLCWTFVSAGARLCQVLGYHREAVVSRDPPKLAEVKRHAFWMLYMIDKTLSLNLGRPSCFPDYDIDVKVFSPSQDSRFRPWDRAFIAFIEFSRLQGRIYDELYSLRAQKGQPESRARIVEELSASFFAWHLEFKKIDSTGAHDKNDLDLIIGSSDFIYYSALNLVYGAKTSPGSATHISSQRYEAARMSLQCHIRNSSKLSASDVPKWRIYSDWILLYSSFTPFLIIFTHSIASHSAEDLHLLSTVLQTLEAPRHNTEAINRLYNVCRVFLEFAKAFVPLLRPSFGFYDKEEDSFTFPAGEEGTAEASMEVAAGAEFEDVDVDADDLESMSVFLGTFLGENSGMSGFWNMDVSNAGWL